MKNTQNIIKKLREFFKDTVFEFGFVGEDESYIAFGDGYSTPLLSHLIISFDKKEIRYERSPARAYSSYAYESYKSQKDLFSTLPKTSEEFYRKIKGA